MAHADPHGPFVCALFVPSHAIRIDIGNTYSMNRLRLLIPARWSRPERIVPGGADQSMKRPCRNPAGALAAKAVNRIGIRDGMPLPAMSVAPSDGSGGEGGSDVRPLRATSLCAQVARSAAPRCGPHDGRVGGERGYSQRRAQSGVSRGSKRIGVRSIKSRAPARSLVAGSAAS